MFWASVSSSIYTILRGKRKIPYPSERKISHKKDKREETRVSDKEGYNERSDKDDAGI